MQQTEQNAHGSNKVIQAADRSSRRYIICFGCLEVRRVLVVVVTEAWDQFRGSGDEEMPLDSTEAREPAPSAVWA